MQILGFRAVRSTVLEPEVKVESKPEVESRSGARWTTAFEVRPVLEWAERSEAMGVVRTIEKTVKVEARTMIASMKDFMMWF